MHNLIEARQLKATRGKFELNIESWDVKPGTVVGVVGRNGAGKSTLLRMIPGFDRVTSGDLSVFGRNPSKNIEFVRTNCGFMTDDLAIGLVRICDALNFASAYYPNWDSELVAGLLERFELDPKKSIPHLSRGEGTRIRLVLALAFSPELLVLDEPATGLDVQQRQKLLETVMETVRNESRAVVISSHQLSDIERIADELLVMDDGKVVAQGPTHELVQEGQSLEEALIGWGER
jgi:ABC-2 type transport system ATP-binding protein